MLSVRNLTIRFGGLTALNGVNLTVREGEILSVIGPNGAGKTTLFNAITGIYPPTEGEIRFRDRDVRLGFRPHTAAGVLTVGALTAAGTLVAVNVQSLWSAVIDANYIYQEPFNWTAAAVSFKEFLKNLTPTFREVPLLGGFFLGLLGAWSVWSRSRYAPHVAVRRGLARTFQNIRLFPQMTVLENVLLGMERRLSVRVWDAALRLRRFFREERKSREEAMEELRFVGLDGEAHLLASALSYGHQRKLEIARALAARPTVLLLDEPAAGMNPAEAAELMELIRRVKERGVTIVLIEHHMKVVMGISDRIAVLDYGNKIAEGTPEEIRCDRRVIDAYLGTEEGTGGSATRG